MPLAHQLPQLKVFSPDNEYVAGCKYAEDAICLAQFRGVGAEVRYGHPKRNVVWRISEDDDLTGDGWSVSDAELLWERVEQVGKGYTYTPRVRKEND